MGNQNALSHYGVLGMHWGRTGAGASVNRVGSKRKEAKPQEKLPRLGKVRIIKKDESYIINQLVK